MLLPLLLLLFLLAQLPKQQHREGDAPLPPLHQHQQLHSRRKTAKTMRKSASHTVLLSPEQRLHRRHTRDTTNSNSSHISNSGSTSDNRLDSSSSSYSSCVDNSRSLQRHVGVTQSMGVLPSHKLSIAEHSEL
jgi:hypothetical protein